MFTSQPTETKMTKEYSYTDLGKARAWYIALSKAGYAATLETVVPGKEWRVVVFS